MAVKLSSLTLSKRIPIWVSLNAHLSSISCAINISEPDQNQSNSPEFEAKIQFLKNKLHPDSLVSVLDSSLNLDSSIKLFKWASLQKRFQHTADTYHRMILKMGLAGNVGEVEGFCNEMIREKCPGFGKCLLALIDSFLSNHRFSEALRVLYVMNLTSFKPSMEVFNSLMGALVEEKRDFKDVLFVYKEMVKAGLLPNIDTLNFLLEALFESGRVDAAIDQYKRMHKKGCYPSSKTFEILISGLYAEDQVENSTLMLNEMFQLGCEPDSSFYSRIIPIFSELRNFEIVIRLFKMMKASNFSPCSAIYTALISCLCENLQVDDAVEIYEEIISSGLFPGPEVHLDIISGFCKLNRFGEAKKFLEENNVMDSSAHNTLLGFYCDTGNFVMAKDLFDEMLEKDIIDAWSWNILIRFFCEKSVMGKALEYLCKMVVSSFFPDSTTYSAIIFGYCRIGNINYAFDLFCYMKSKAWVLDSVSYAELVDSLCSRGNTQEAIEVFRYMCSRECALEPTSFNSILRGLYKSGQENYNFVIFSKMIVIGCDFDAETYCILIQSMASLNRVGNYVSILKLMLSKDLLPDSETLALLFSCLDNNSQVHLILPSIDELVSKQVLDSMLYNMLINSLLREGFESEARRLLDLMLEKGWVPNGSTHALIMGSVQRTELVSNKFGDENFGVHDTVSSILVEGLGET